jgi:hypothetical protein
MPTRRSHSKKRTHRAKTVVVHMKNGTTYRRRKPTHHKKQHKK